MRTQKTRGHWLKAAVTAGAVALSGQALAEPVSLSLDYTCTYPLIGDEPLTADISSDIPAEIAAGDPTGSFDIDVIATAKGDTRSGLELVGATNVEGTANAASNLSGNNLNLDVDVPITIPNQVIPAGTGSFQLTANGSTPSLTFSENNEGDVVITVGALDMALIARDDSGTAVMFPNSDPNTGEFPVPCTLDAGQDNVLHTFAVTTEPDPVPDIDVAPTSVDFGEVLGGMTDTATVTVSNTGGAPLGINGVSLSGTNAADFMQTNDCTTVAAGGSCTVELTFFASGEGVRDATLSISSTDPDEPTVDVSVTGTSVIEDPQDIAVDPTSVDFGTVDPGDSATDSVTVTNNGGDPLDITGISISGANAGDFMQTNDCAQLAADASCTVDLTFTPSTDGARNATLSIDSNDPDTPTVDVALSGEGATQDGGGVDIAADLEGSTKLKNISTPISLSGMVDATVDLATGMLTADLTLDPTEAVLKLPFFKVYADIAFEQTEQTTGTFSAGNLSTESRMDIVLTKLSVSFFGWKVPIGGGDQCRTIDPALIQLDNPDDQPFSLQDGGPVEGTYTIPPVDNCGGLEDLLNPIMAGPDNQIQLQLTPKP